MATYIWGKSLVFYLGGVSNYVYSVCKCVWGVSYHKYSG